MNLADDLAEHYKKSREFDLCLDISKWVEREKHQSSFKPRRKTVWMWPL